MKGGFAVNAYKKLIDILEESPNDLNYKKWMVDDNIFLLYISLKTR
jgi:hypothetical protein